MSEFSMSFILVVAFLGCIGSAVEKDWKWFNFSLIILFCSAFGLVIRIIS